MSLREEDVNGIRELGGFMVPLNDMLKARNGDFRHDTVFFSGRFGAGHETSFMYPRRSLANKADECRLCEIYEFGRGALLLAHFGTDLDW